MKAYGASFLVLEEVDCIQVFMPVALVTDGQMIPNGSSRWSDISFMLSQILNTSVFFKAPVLLCCRLLMPYAPMGHF